MTETEYFNVRCVGDFAKNEWLRHRLRSILGLETAIKLQD